MNRGGPKFALHNCTINLAEDMDKDAVVAEEGDGVDSRSLTRMQDNVMPRKSITSDIT